MAKKIRQFSHFDGGTADYTHESLIPNAFAFSRSADVRTDPTTISILPRTIKESGSVVTDLIQWADTPPTSALTTYAYGNTGNFYSRTSAASYALLRTIAVSHGNGLAYFAEDDFIYYTRDKVIGRYGPMSATTPQFTDDFLGAQGGVALNTNAVDFEASSSQYASRADTASLSITGNLSIEAQIKPESLPTVGNTMTLVSKWDESGALRSYKFDIAAVSGYFGDGSDGALTISADTTEAPIDSACTGTTGTFTLSATNASFAAGQVIFIHQTRGTGAGAWQRNSISTYTAGTITLGTALNATYVSGAQVRVLPQYSAVTINSGKTYTAKAWNGTVGGILGFVCSGTITVTGNISATGKGFLGGVAGAAGVGIANCGEGTGGASAAQQAANGNGGGAGNNTGIGDASGGGGGNGAAGENGGSNEHNVGGGVGGTVAGAADLTTIAFGGGGGAGKSDDSTPGGGSAGGGIVFLTGATLTIAGTVVSSGVAGVGGTQAAGGGGAGGSVLLKAQTATLGTALITASGGAAGVTTDGDTPDAGAGGTGRVHLDYYTSYTGTSTPTVTVIQDNALVTTTSYQLRLAVSSTGSNTETLAQVFSPVTGIWQDVAVSWTAATSTAIFYFNAVAIGTRVGTLTAIHDNASTFQIAMNKTGAGAAANFYDGLMDEVRVIAAVRTAQEYLDGLNQQILTTTALLKAYYKLNADYTDASGNSNTLTATNTPVFVTDVPYSSPTTRLDIDQSATTTTNTYALGTAINEGATHRKTFTPGKDPQKSAAFLIAAIGTGDWTVTVHDSLNNTLATATAVNATLATGYYEFTYTALWSPLTNFTNSYHFHLTSTVADGTVTATTSNDLETVSYRTYYQFLMTDVNWHPIARMLQFLVFGNGHYIGKIEASVYYPNWVALPAGWKIRCFGYWNEYLAVGCWKGTAITDFDAGRVYFWDGIAPTYNFFIDVPEGGVNAILGSKGILNIWAGYQGDHLVYQGGATAQKIKRLPKITSDKYVEVFPGAVTMWKALVRYGESGNSDSTEVQKGVYTYGSTNTRYPDILTFDYPISTGNYGSTVKVGLTYVVDQKLLVSWQDNAAFGVDYVDASNAVYPTATVEFLINDEDMIYKEKELVTIAANFTTLVDGQTVSLKRKVNEEDNWTSNADATVAGDTVSRMVISDGRYNQVQVAVDLATTLSTGPTISGITYESEGMESSGRIG